MTLDEVLKVANLAKQADPLDFKCEILQMNFEKHPIWIVFKQVRCDKSASVVEEDRGAAGRGFGCERNRKLLLACRLATACMLRCQQCYQNRTFPH